MPYFVIDKFNGPFATEREAADYLSTREDGCTLLRGEQIKFTTEVVRRVVIDTRTLPLFVEPVAPVTEPPVTPEPVAAKPKRVGKYGGKSVPEQVREYLVSKAPEQYTPSDIAADLALPANNVAAAVHQLRKRGVITGNGRVSAVIP